MPANMEEDFIATIKIITGEELISKVSYMPDDDSLVLENPMEVTRIDHQKANVKVNGFALNEWIHSTFDHMFVLPKQHVITMTEIEDKKILQDKQGLILAGADRALREMLSIFRDDPIEGPLQEASMGVWTKILQEES